MNRSNKSDRTYKTNKTYQHFELARGGGFAIIIGSNLLLEH